MEKGNADWKEPEMNPSRCPFLTEQEGVLNNMKEIDFGKIIMDIAPQPDMNNPRNSEGAFLTLADGRILFAFSRFKGKDAADHAASDIYALFSDDDGETFGNCTPLLTCEEERGINIMSVSLMHMNNGDIGIFYLLKETKRQVRMFHRRSKDNGKTWGQRVLCTPMDGVLVVNNDRVLRLSNGNLFIPVANHVLTEDFYEEYAEFRCFYSEDDGATWQQSPGRCSMPYLANSGSGLQEPGVLELQPGILWGWARTDLGRQYEMFSFDYGMTWSNCQPSRFTGPKSPLSMKMNEKGVLYSIWNPIPEYNGRKTIEGVYLGGRNPYVIAASKDLGKRFSEPIAFETDELSGYCYSAIHFHKDSMLLAYCAGNAEDGNCLTRCRIRKIPMKQLEKELLTD